MISLLIEHEEDEVMLKLKDEFAAKAIRLGCTVKELKNEDEKEQRPIDTGFVYDEEQE